MFNEAFWFFYLVGVASNLATLTVVGGSISLAVIAIAALVRSVSIDTKFVYANERDAWLNGGKQAAYKKVRKDLFAWLPMPIVLFVIHVFIPPPDAMYAGAGLYVAEETEVTDTLLRLKDVVDARIEELMPEQAQQQESAQ